ncbi:MAG: hypothetical protein IK990_15125 [Ruminiclostridium sp.]|nr:hypothetical protein [Ruminiclostridium sp.]MBP3856935.1 hypothetical protein [Ruminiclostridium sp.]
MKRKQNERITYKECMTRQDISKYAKAIGFPLVAFAVNIWTITNFRAFGTELIAPLSAAIWVAGLVTGLILPSHRRTTLNETVIALVGYSVVLMGLRYALQLISGVSTEMLIASYGQIISLTGGSAVQGYIQNILWISAIMVPIGFIGMQAKKLVQFRRLMAKNKALDRIRSIRETNR